MKTKNITFRETYGSKKKLYVIYHTKYFLLQTVKWEKGVANPFLQTIF